MNRKAVSGGIWFLLEMLLAVIVLLSLWAIVDGIVTGNDYFESFFAKDNAYIVESLHAVPNGQAYVGYLWSGGAFNVSFEPQNKRVRVQKLADRIEQQTIGGASKAYGASAHVLIEGKEFPPRYYQFVREPGAINIEERFSLASCPTSTAPFAGMSASGSDDGFAAGTAARIAGDIAEGVRTAKAGAFGTSGLSLHIHAVRTQVEGTEIYYANAQSEQATAIACLLARAVSEDVPNARYGHISFASDAVRSYDADITVVIRGEDSASLTRVAGKLRDGFVSYGKGGSS